MVTKLVAILKKKRAVVLIISLILLGHLGGLLIFNILNAGNVTYFAQQAIASSSRSFRNLEKNQANMLLATLEVLMTNQDLSRLFKERNRDLLFEKAWPIFRQLKAQNGITHWYFLNGEEERNCFLRIHNHNLFGDRITRFTYDRAVDNKQHAIGKELGKTAFALRVVHPYYYEGELIGYMELGIELQFLLNQMKKQTGYDCGLLALKDFIDRQKWDSLIKVKGLRNNWNDMTYQLVISATGSQSKLFQFDGSLTDIPDVGESIDFIEIGKQKYVRGIFPIYDAGDQKLGAIFALIDISGIITNFSNQKRIISFMVFIWMSIIGGFMVYFHSRAEKELRKYRFQLEEMVQERTEKLSRANVQLKEEISERLDAEKKLADQFQARILAEQERRKAVQLAEQSARLASIGVMAAGITHEINQPLNSIKVTADSIQFWNNRNPDQLPGLLINQLGTISQSVKRIEVIIRHMRAFWVVKEGEKEEQIKLQDVVHHALSLTRQQITDNRIDLKLQLTAEILMVEGNTVHLEQILINLLVNAIQSLKEANIPTKNITITLKKRHSHAELSVSDNGPGIDKGDLEHLFDPFYSTKTAGEGMGLGLAIVKRYIDKYHGTIDVANLDGGGVMFTFRLPLSVKKKA